MEGNSQSMALQSFLTCAVVNLRSSDVVPPLLLNFTQDESGDISFCGNYDRSIMYKVEQ